MDFRAEINARLGRLGKSKAWLVAQVGGDPGQNTVYRFLRGDGDVTSTHLARLIDALDAEEKRHRKQK
jgi:hypothetical protein